MDLHPGEEIVFEGHPSWRGLLSFYITAVGAAIVVAVIVALVAAIVTGIVVGVVLVALALLVGFVKRMATRYLVTTQRLHIRRGILSRHTQQTRIDRVQNVNTDQTLVDRILRVGAVDFDTAGTDDSDFRFVGIASPHRVVAAVDRAQREASQGGGEPDIAPASGTTPAG
jgi:uncharacterized membrane protein YdbT with pleckstrin-like domain